MIDRSTCELWPSTSSIHRRYCGAARTPASSSRLTFQDIFDDWRLLRITGHATRLIDRTRLTSDDHLIHSRKPITRPPPNIDDDFWCVCHCWKQDRDRDLPDYWSETMKLTLCVYYISERELMFMFAICRRPSVCLSSVVCRLSSVCL